MNDNEIDEIARQMSDGARNGYLVAHGWQDTGVGWWPRGGTEKHFPGGEVILTNTAGGGLYSRSSAIREQLAREDPDSGPDDLGRYYHSGEPEGSFGKRW
jgi:hypothetical protein